MKCIGRRWPNWSYGSTGPRVTVNSLKFLHSASDLNRVKLEGFRRLSTQELKDSLRPGQARALKKRPDGTLLDGHHRIQILIERDADVNGLAREIMEKKV